MTWNWLMFFALLLPMAATVIAYEVHSYFTKTKPRRAVREAKRQALKLWQSGEVFGGQVYRHHSGREYMIIAISNGYCDDQDKWPVTVMYCDLKFQTHYSRSLYQFLQTMTLDREVDNSLPNPLLEMMAMVTYKTDNKKGNGLPQIGSVWYCTDNPGGEFELTTEITVKEIANIDRSQPVVVYIENKYPHDLRAMNLYQFLRKFKRKQETAA